MDATSLALGLGLILFFALLALGLEIIWCFIASGVVIYVIAGYSLGDIPAIVYHNVDKDVLMAVAYFILAGGLMGAGGIADKLVSWVNHVVGWVRGGLAAVAIGTSLIFGALTGSGLTSIAALVPLLGGRMEEYGYSRAYSAAVICASGFMGLLIPPSIPLMLFALMAEESVAALFASTILPGCLLAIFYFAVNFVFCRRWMTPVSAPKSTGNKTDTRAWVRRFSKDTYVAFPALLFPVILIGGIFGGVFTPTEAAAVSCAYAILIGIFVYKGLNLKNLKTVFVEAGGTIGMVVILVGFGMFFSRVLLRVGVAEAMVNGILSVTHSPVLILLLINILLLVLGMFMESICILLITVPLLLPLFAELGMNPIHAGAMVCINIGIGQITPPFAVGLFVGARLSGVQVHEIAKPALLYILLGAVPVLLLTTYIPDLALWLPTAICGPDVVGIVP